MHMIITKEERVLAYKVAKKVAEFINGHPDELLCFAAGDTPLKVFDELIKMQKNGEVDLNSVYYVGLDEWVGLGIKTFGSCVQVMNDHFYAPAGISPERKRVWDGLAEDMDKEIDEMNQWIRMHGGISLTLLGIGMNGHIGFNEPNTGLQMGCIQVPLDDTTKSVSVKYFDSALDVKYGIGVGAGELKAAKKVILMASGEKKAHIVYKTLKEEPNPSVPSSLMIDHEGFEIYLDEQAASLLENN